MGHEAVLAGPVTGWRGTSNGDAAVRWPEIAESRNTCVAIPPSRIAGKTFTIALRGYDKDEVDAYLESLAEEQRTLTEALREAERKTAAEADEYSKLGDYVGAIARSVTEAAEAIRNEAAEQASLVRAEAEHHAAEIRAEAERELNAAQQRKSEIEQEATLLRSHAEHEAAQMRAEAAEEQENAHRMMEAARELQQAAERHASERRESIEEALSEARRAAAEEREAAGALRASAEQEAARILEEAAQVRRNAEMETDLVLQAARRALDNVEQVRSGLVHNDHAGLPGEGGEKPAEPDPAVDAGGQWGEPASAAGEAHYVDQPHQSGP